MTDWPAFAGFAGVVLAALLVLARLSQAAIDREGVDAPDSRDASAPSTISSASSDASIAPPDSADPAGPDDGEELRPADGEREPNLLARTGPATPGGADPAPTREPSTAALLANVAVSQGVLGSLLLAGAWYTGVPAAAFGVGPATLDGEALAAGVAVGVALYAANEAGAAAGRRAGFGGGEELRRALAPSSRRGWAALLLVVLPVIAGFEELLFRGALVGALHAGFGVSPWLLAAASSVAFAAGHGAQGPVGVVVTGTLGFVLAAAFVLTGSLLTVVVAHYLVNALEFLVHEWAGVDPAAGEWGRG